MNGDHGRGLGCRALVLGVALLTAGCSGSSEWNEADRAFVAGMLPHHHLGMELVEEATVDSADVRLRRLVFEMSGYHGSEVGLLERWAVEQRIDEWEVFPGGLPASDLALLDTLTGIEHDVWWLDLMIRHHEGAVAMADRVVAQGAADPVRRLALDVRRVQAAEIETMEELLGSMCGDVAVGLASVTCAQRGLGS